MMISLKGLVAQSAALHGRKRQGIKKAINSTIKRGGVEHGRRSEKVN